MTTAAARTYIASCRTTGQPVNLARAEALSGLSGGPLARFVVAALAEAPCVSPPPRKRNGGSTVHDGWAALGAAIYEAEAVKSDEHRAAIGRSMCEYWKRRKSQEAVAA